MPRDARSGPAVVCRCAAELAEIYVTLLCPEFVPVWGKHTDWQNIRQDWTEDCFVHLNRDVTVCSNVAACLTCGSEQLWQWCRIALGVILFVDIAHCLEQWSSKVFSEGRKGSVISCRGIRDQLQRDPWSVAVGSVISCRGIRDQLQRDPWSVAERSVISCRGIRDQLQRDPWSVAERSVISCRGIRDQLQRDPWSVAEGSVISCRGIRGTFP
jgi:hypothetical protein